MRITLDKESKNGNPYYLEVTINYSDYPSKYIYLSSRIVEIEKLENGFESVTGMIHENIDGSDWATGTMKIENLKRKSTKKLDVYRNMLTDELMEEALDSYINTGTALPLFKSTFLQ